ncbi:hypothetical protein BGZ83_001572 [Gryganskiella cystojenkinii]|nr:hypothetical protein BGZ83_001572 [Gryganskiella cystojenkinii]
MTTEPVPAAATAAIATPSPIKYNREDAQTMGPYLVCENPPHYLSAVEETDIPEMVRILNLDDSIFRASSAFLFPYTEENAKRAIDRAYRVVEKRGINTHWAVRTSPQGKIMGWMHIHTHGGEPQKPESSTIMTTTASLTVREGRSGYWISPEHRAQGYGARSLKFLLNEIAAKEPHGYDLVKCEAFVENMASQKVMERAGMILEHTDLVVDVDAYGEEGKNKRIATYVWWSPSSPHSPLSSS